MRNFMARGWVLLASLMLIACDDDQASQEPARGLGGLGGAHAAGGSPENHHAGGAGGEAGAGGDAAGGHAGAPNESDTIAPKIASLRPADGALGVWYDAQVVITFSEPMDMGSVQRAFLASELGVNDLSFQWNLAGTELTVTPTQPLEFAQGDENVEAVTYHFSLSDEATDVAGNALAAKEFSFSTARLITRILSPGKGSGTLMSDGSHSGLVEGAADVGERGASPSIARRGFFTFDLAGLEGETLLQSATLSTTVTVNTGDPFDTFGALSLGSLHYGSLGADDFALLSPSPLVSFAAAGTKSVDVTSAVQADLDDPTDTLSQFRGLFPGATGNHGIHSALVAPTLTLTYLGR